MRKPSILHSSLLLGAILLVPSFACAQNLQPIELPKPQIESGKPLMQALNERKSSRSFSPKKLPPQVLSNLLWAAFGVNRPATGGRTAPSANNWQEMDIYAAMAEGVYRYDAKANRLVPVLAGDIRAKTGSQPFVGVAPVDLIYVGDYSKMTTSDVEKPFYSGVHTGLLTQNVYLYCASEGLATVVRGMIDRTAVAELLKLPADQKVTLGQTVGYPEE